MDKDFNYGNGNHANDVRRGNVLGTDVTFSRSNPWRIELETSISYNGQRLTTRVVQPLQLATDGRNIRSTILYSFDVCGLIRSNIGILAAESKYKNGVPPGERRRTIIKECVV